jgi:enoyl-CoA hydratase/carnithine racemase
MAADRRTEPSQQCASRPDDEEHEHPSTVPRPDPPAVDPRGAGADGRFRRVSGTGSIDELRYDVRARVATITIDREHRRNALSWSVIAGMRELLATAKHDPEVRVVVLTGAGDRAFCAGADLGNMADGAGFTELHDGRGELAGLFRDLYALGKPTIARVRGHALAGGFGLALACDLVIAGERATFGTPEINVGLFPFMIAALIERNIGRKKMTELLLLGQRIDAHEALRLGIVNRVVAPADFDAAVADWAAQLAAKSPVLMKLGRDALFAQQDMALGEALEYLRAQLTLALSTDDAREGVAAFLERREPRWTGR